MDFVFTVRIILGINYILRMDFQFKAQKLFFLHGEKFITYPQRLST